MEETVDVGEAAAAMIGEEVADVMTEGGGTQFA